MTELPPIRQREAPSLHDAELVGMEIDRQRETMLLRFLLPEGGGMTTLAFSGVSHFRATDVIPQNAVSRILLSDRFTFSDEQILFWTKWVTSLADTSFYSDEAQCRQILELISQRERLLCVIEPSWGAEIAIICDAMTCETHEA